MSENSHHQRSVRRSLAIVGLLVVAGITPVGCGEDQLTLIDGDATFDFTPSGVPGERAREEFVLVRR